MFNYGTPEQYTLVKINGWGTGYFEGIKITADGYGTLSENIHLGTIIGWPGLP